MTCPPHHYVVASPEEGHPPHGVCKLCGATRTFTNAKRRGQWPSSEGVSWATVHADAADYGRRMAIARAARKAKRETAL